jgi:hypothetical protein
VSRGGRYDQQGPCHRLDKRGEDRRGQGRHDEGGDVKSDGSQVERQEIQCRTVGRRQGREDTNRRYRYKHRKGSCEEQRARQEEDHWRGTAVRGRREGRDRQESGGQVRWIRISKGQHGRWSRARYQGD